MRRILIMGAAGRDFHVFNTCYRGVEGFDVVAFTATQIPHIEERRYPAALAGARYPDGIPIYPESRLAELIAKLRVEEVVFAYSDVTNSYVEEKRAFVGRSGASFSTFSVDATMLPSKRPVIAVTAVRTGCGKSQTARRVVTLLREAGCATVVLRHPMPYGELERQAVQRFANLDDLDRHDCTIEEREEYEPHIARGAVVFAGADYAAILAEAEQEAEVLVWDGGNNDTPFLAPTLWIAVADAHRPGHELTYFPGTENFRRAHLIIINKIDTAHPENVAAVAANAARVNPRAAVVRARSPVSVADPAAIRGRRVLVIEDGPTTTHGGMVFGAGVIAARQFGAAELVDPRPFARGEITETFTRYPHLERVLPAMGYGRNQLDDLEATIAATDCELVLIATPIDLGRMIRIDKPWMRVTYELAEEGNELSEAVARVAATRFG
jgi:predicted GTPase